MPLPSVKVHDELLLWQSKCIAERTDMGKPGIVIEIPRFRTLEIQTMVSDYTGTLSCRGKLSAGVREQLLMLNERIDIHVVSSDSFGTAEEELSGLPVIFENLSTVSGPHDIAKLKYVEGLNPPHVVAFGNGNK